MLVKRNVRKARLTKSYVDALTSEPRDYVVWDDKQPGFCVKVTRNGAKTFWVVGRPPGARNPVWVKVGVAVGRYNPEALRGEAAQRLAEMRRGDNPNTKRRQSRTARTLDALWETYAHTVKPTLAASTFRTYEKHYENELRPRFGRTLLAAITHEDVVRWHAGIARTRPYLANRCLALLRAMLNKAEKFGDLPRGANPARGVRLARERGRERFLSDAERRRLDKALDAAVTEGLTYPVAAIRLLMATGARRNEILTLKWEWVSYERGLIELPDSKTGGKPIILSSHAVALLKAIPRQKGNPHVIAGRLAGSHLTDLEKPWQRIRAAAGLDDVRLHDLRHTYASTALMRGVPLSVVGRLLGHKDVKTTQRYAHIADQALREAAELVTAPAQGAEP